MTHDISSESQRRGDDLRDCVPPTHVAIVLLNYNSAKDLQVSAPQLAAQSGVRVSLIIVDNASRPDEVEEIQRWLVQWKRDLIDRRCPRAKDSGSFEQADIYFVAAKSNGGYSAGNNVGLRLAQEVGAEFALICNPDMRVEDRTYVQNLAVEMIRHPKSMIAGSRIVDLDGNDQSPLREPSAFEEIAWPRWWLKRWLPVDSYVLPPIGTSPYAVPKISGCCLMLRMSFLVEDGFLDDSVFLYCEEPILSARVKRKAGVVLFVPSIQAVHAHVRDEKQNSSLRMLEFIKSRRIFLKNYSGYARWKITAISVSYFILAAYQRASLIARGHGGRQ